MCKSVENNVYYVPVLIQYVMKILVSPLPENYGLIFLSIKVFEIEIRLVA